ncbi:hypothetical protein RASY3_09215 [Ruminococcus albus SY3]|uniref:HNH domain-containing protein n=1 Tax=Ruminococcus albus SY3 TaxID=1341156 RepID=A0A011WTB3_RUMAL|nr:HNH endonuclease [Ruminococcus albus]EXM40270.1 hypothetical protein RASY3_09215 [Ruminococcus albus SY3]
MIKHEPIKLIITDNESVEHEMTQDDIYDLLPDVESFKTTDYYNYSKQETKDYTLNLSNAMDFFLREKKRMEDDKGYKKAMKAKYDQFSRSGNKIYNQVYSRIKTSEDVCVYCNLRNRDIAELDHFFPKATFPSLAISINNLIPSCSYCNHPKNDNFPLDYVLLHPYYDNCLDNVYDYLKYKINEFKGYNIVGEFYIDKTENMDDYTYIRIIKHFEFFDLNKYYKKDFISDYDEFVETLNNIDCLKEKLEKKRDYNRKKRSAPWLYAGFDALTHSEDFFRIIENKLCRKEEFMSSQ